MSRLAPSVSLILGLVAAAAVAACGGGGDDPASATTQGAGGSTAGSSAKGGAAGTSAAGAAGAAGKAQAGASGAAGKAGAGGAAGAGAAGKAGAAGGSGAAGGAGKAGAAGSAGAAGTAGAAGGAGKAGTGGSGGSPPDAIVLEPPAVSVTIDLGAVQTQDYKVTGFFGATKKDITSECSLSLGDAAFGTFAGGTLTIADHGGQTLVTAVCGAKQATSTLTVTVHGVTIDPGSPLSIVSTFGNAMQKTDASKTPAMEYPIHGSTTPLNMPSPVAQWASPLDLHHLTVKGQYAHFELYTTKKEAAMPIAHWNAAVATAAGGKLDFSVESIATSDPTSKYTSAPSSHFISPDVIKGTAIYWWASSKGSIQYQTFGNTDAPKTLKADCTSCHSLSRSGTRLGYSRCVNGDCGNLKQGFMRFDKTTGTWVETVDANNQQITGSYSAFAPLGYPYPDDDKSAAIVSLSNGHLELFDPDTGSVLPSNIQDACTKQGPTGTMPDWSPTGAVVAFATTPNPGQWIDVDSSRIATMSYTYSGGNHTFGDAQILFGTPVNIPQGSFTNFFFPAFSPDGSVLVANGARAPWRNFSDGASPGQRLFLADPKGGWVVDLLAANGAGDLNITWPKWAPLSNGQHLWVLFSSERDYGHLLTKSNTAPVCAANGVKQCKQLWIAAIDKKKLPGPGGMLMVDPSSPPVWLPGQDLGADNISPTWTVPAQKN